MITKRVFLAEMELPESRSVIAHFLMVMEEDGREIMRSNPHTVCFTPEADAAAMFDAVNANITTRQDMLWPPIPAEEWARAVAVCEATHTPEVKAAYEAWKAAQLAKAA
jgi:hypothetical protein